MKCACDIQLCQGDPGLCAGFEFALEYGRGVFNIPAPSKSPFENTWISPEGNSVHLDESGSDGQL